MIFTIGHSTRSLEEFVALLKAHRVDKLADVRTVPRSRRHPHFSSDALAVSLRAAGVTYRHFSGLGGLRKPRRDSTNTAWRHSGFRGYADFMETPAFDEALEDLLMFDRPGNVERVVIMCAEGVWWRCHRQLIADALVARGIDVGHITSSSPPSAHRLTEFARVEGGEVRYPGLV